MKHFKLVQADGAVEELEADRVVRDEHTIYADYRVGGRWFNVRSLASDEVEEVRRRITDFNGQLRWIRHRTTFLPSRFDVAHDDASPRMAP